MPATALAVDPASVMRAATDRLDREVLADPGPYDDSDSLDDLDPVEGDLLLRILDGMRDGHQQR